MNVGAQYRNFSIAEFNRDRQAMIDANIKFLRIGFVNTSSSSNPLISTISNSGIQIVGCLLNTSLVNDMTGWANYVRTTISNYRDYVKVWEIWNEPENQVSLPTGLPTDLGQNAVKYAQLLNAAYPAAKQADPACMILGGAVSSLEPVRMTWIDNILSYGAGNSMDAMSVHPYCENKSPLPPTVTGGGKAFWKTQYVRDMLDSYGLSNMHVWITEVGWKASYSSDPSFTEDTQAQYLRDAWNYAVANWNSWLDTFIIYQWIDYGDTFGLLRSDATQRPAYDAVKNFSQPSPIQKYYFSHWNDGDVNPTKTVTL